MGVLTRQDAQRWLDAVVVDAAIFALQPDYCAGLMVIGGMSSSHQQGD